MCETENAVPLEVDYIAQTGSFSLLIFLGEINRDVYKKRWQNVVATKERRPLWSVLFSEGSIARNVSERELGRSARSVVSKIRLIRHYVALGGAKVNCFSSVLDSDKENIC